MKLWLVVVVAVVGAACTSAAPAPTATPTPTFTPTETVTLSLVTPTATATSVAETPQAFLLKVLAPQDEAVVTTASIQVRGETIPSAVVTVNGQIVEVDADGQFQVTLTLEEGPNVIDIIATDEDGNEVAVELVIFRAPR